ncbi:Cro/Cl family transcriptional regulator [Paracoccus suum]|uniref:Cro/Cl family transcriptional regulator n=1 Tax=Paracoccus suum TaxID=2259340 RepID=A0A344PKY3_9RHOB|nr:YdaS family helix-turn-helix protein [Paracoccus suum]AXC50038.1 Cro/Cl family transcriptional regulator [Paracoccus suum]
MTHFRPHIERAIDLLGSQAKLAEAAKCSQQQISYLLRAPSITAEMALAIEAATGGQVSKSVLRPDIFQERGAA